MTTRKKATAGKGKGKEPKLKATIRDLDVKRTAGHVRGGAKKHIGNLKYEDITITPT